LPPSFIAFQLPSLFAFQPPRFLASTLSNPQDTRTFTYYSGDKPGSNIFVDGNEVKGGRISGAAPPFI
jgi:hypothetical protein